MANVSVCVYTLQGCTKMNTLNVFDCSKKNMKNTLMGTSGEFNSHLMLLKIMLHTSDPIADVLYSRWRVTEMF